MVKIWSLPKQETLTTGKTYCGKEEKLLLRSNFSSFSQYFQYICNFKSPVTHIFVKCCCLSYFFLNSANLICRGTDISKYFREFLGIRDTESRLYMYICIYIYIYIYIYKKSQKSPPTERSAFEECLISPFESFCPLLVGENGHSCKNLRNILIIYGIPIDTDKI